MVPESDVIAAYKLFLGREPEDPSTVKRAAAGFDSLEDMRNAFLTSAEFQKTVPSKYFPLHGAPNKVDINVPPALLSAMIARVERLFEHLGRVDPHWSVLSAPKYRASEIEKNEAEFYASGTTDVRNFMAALARSGLTLKPDSIGFELGCGVGRTTVHLAPHFKTLIGADVSQHHLDLAAAACQKAGVTNVQFELFRQVDQLDRLPELDVFLSVIVLQHNAPPIIAQLLRKLLGRLKKGGLGYFQVPVYHDQYAFNARKYLETPAKMGELEMHLIPQVNLFQILQETGCRPVEIREDGAAGPEFVSLRLLVQKV